MAGMEKGSLDHEIMKNTLVSLKQEASTVEKLNLKEM